MKRILIYTIAILTIGACVRRPLEDELAVTALIPVCIDWSASGVETSTMHRATVILFPQDGSAPLEYRLEQNLTYKEIAVPKGVYSVVVFNETTDKDDFENIEFVNTKNYNTFAAVTVINTTRGWYTRSETLPLVYSPEPLAAWSLDRFEVTDEMITQTRYIAHQEKNSAQRSPALEAAVPDLTKVKPLPRYEKVTVTARVANLASSMQATATLNGMANGVYMVSGTKINTRAAHAIILNGRIYDADGKSGTTTKTFTTFGFLPIANYVLVIDFLLVDGTLAPQEKFDVTKLVTTLPNTIVPHHTIDVGLSYDDGDHPINLPDMDVKNTINVSDWDEVIIPIK